MKAVSGDKSLTNNTGNCEFSSLLGTNNGTDVFSTMDLKGNKNFTISTDYRETSEQIASLEEYVTSRVARLDDYLKLFDNDTESLPEEEKKILAESTRRLKMLMGEREGTQRPYTLEELGDLKTMRFNLLDTIRREMEFVDIMNDKDPSFFDYYDCDDLKIEPMKVANVGKHAGNSTRNRGSKQRHSSEKNKNVKDDSIDSGKGNNSSIITDAEVNSRPNSLTLLNVKCITEENKITLLGFIKGYLNKEIAKGETVDTRADFYLTRFKALNFTEEAIIDMNYKIYGVVSLQANDQFPEDRGN